MSCFPTRFRLLLQRSSIARFTGGENLEHADVRLQAYDDSGGALQIFFDSNVSSAMKTNRAWLPQSEGRCSGCADQRVSFVR
jgi:hypothetical protein